MIHHTSFALLLAFALVGCEYGEPEYIDFDNFSQSVAPFQPTWESTSNVMNEAPWDTFASAYAEELAADQTTSNGNARYARSTDIISLVRGLVDMALHKKIHQVAGTYSSIDASGEPITLSGKVFYPEKGDIKNIILVSHFTIGASFECPSETFALEGILAAKGYMVVIPDYIGYGITKDRVHPYLNATITAFNVINMLDAVREWLPSRSLPILSDSIILFGYSQGGATTMHVLAMMEDINETDLSNPLYKIKKVYAGSGPYDVALTYDLSIQRDVTGIPCAVPMIIQGLSEGMREPLDMAYFFKEPLLSNYKDWLNSKNYTVKQINLLIGKNKLSDILTVEGRDKRSEETQRLYKRLSENSLSSFYLPHPSTSIYLFHSMDDTTVPFINSQSLQIQFEEGGCTNVEYDFGHYGQHTPGMLKFLIHSMKQL